VTWFPLDPGALGVAWDWFDPVNSADGPSLLFNVATLFAGVGLVFGATLGAVLRSAEGR
jgi:hypothetical protein